MENISLDSALNLPTIDPAPTRQPAGRGNSFDRFDDHLQRAGSPPVNHRDPNKPSSEVKHVASKPAEAPSQNTSDSSSELRKDDSQFDGAECEESGAETASTACGSEETKETEATHNDEPSSPDMSGGADAAAASVALATAQNATPPVTTQLAATSNAVAQPEQIGSLDDAGEQSNGVPAMLPETDAEPGLSLVSTPDATAGKVVEPDGNASRDLHAAAITQPETTLPHAPPDNTASDRVTANSSSADQGAGESVAAVEGDVEAGDRKRHAGKTRLTASDDMKLDAAAATEAKSPLPSHAAATGSGGDSSSASGVASETNLPPAAMHAADNHPSHGSVSAAAQVADAVGKHSPAAQVAGAASPSSAERMLEGSPRVAKGGDNTSEVERARFVQRVSKAFQTASQRGEPLRLRLSPPELGSVRMEVSIRSGAMTAKLQAETPAAQSMLLDNLPALRERLAQHNIKIERFDVDLFGQQNEGSQQSPSDAFDRQATQTLPVNSARQRGSKATEEKPVAVAGYRGSGTGQINVII